MGRRIDSMSPATNGAHKHHFIVGKTKKTYSTDCKNSHEKEQTGIFCDLKTCFYLPLSGYKSVACVSSLLFGQHGRQPEVNRVVIDGE